MLFAPARRDALEQTLDRFLDERSQARRFHKGAIGRGVDPAHCLADFLCRVRSGDTAGIAKSYFPEIAKGASANLSELSGPQGGYLVPTQLSERLLGDLSTGSLFRRLGAPVVPMASESETLPVVDVAPGNTTAGVSPYYGGMQFFWLADNTTFPKTNPKFREVQLKAHSQGGYLYVSNPLMQDAGGMDSWFHTMLANGLAWYQDLAFFQGNGVGKPRGVIGSPAAVNISRTGTGGSANHIVAANAQAMLDALLPSAYESGACWFCHPTALSQLAAFTGWIPNGPLELFGRPVVPTGKCATLGTPGDLILAAPSLYVIGDRLQYEIAFSRHEPTAMLTNKTAFRAYGRVDGQTLTGAPITLSDGTSLVSPFVVLN